MSEKSDIVSWIFVWDIYDCTWQADKEQVCVLDKEFCIDCHQIIKQKLRLSDSQIISPSLLSKPS
jgi:hypothetical protein